MKIEKERKFGKESESERGRGGREKGKERG